MHTNPDEAQPSSILCIFPNHQSLHHCFVFIFLFESDSGPMGEISQSAVIVICIAGAAFAVLLGYAVFRFFTNNDRQGPEDMSNDQKDYMREVRRRNKGLNDFETRADKYDRRNNESTME